MTDASTMTTPARPRKAHRRTFGAVRRLPSGRYQARYRGPDAIERPAPRTFATKVEADNWLSTQQADITRDAWQPPERGEQQLQDYAHAWLGTQVRLAPRTLAHYDRLLELAVLPRVAGVQLGSMPLRRITPETVRLWHAALTREAAARAVLAGARLPENAAIRQWATAAGHAVKATGRISPAVLTAWRSAGSPRPPAAGNPGQGRTWVARAYALLREVLNAAIRDGLIDRNPCQIRHATSVDRPERVPATPDEVALLAQLVPARWAAAVTVAAWSGLRAGELFALRRRDVDLTAATVRVERALVDLDGERITFGPPKSRAGRRTVALPASVFATLLEHLDAFTPPERDALVFGTATGRPLDRAARSKMFGRARAQIGRDDLRWHDLRHTGATLAASTGASLAELQRRLGHSTVRAAMIYQHASDERDRVLADRLDELTRPSGTLAVIRRGAVS